MTAAEAAGILLRYYIEQKELDPALRREVIAAIPPECRFVVHGTRAGQLAYLEIIQAILDQVQEKLSKPTLNDPDPWAGPNWVGKRENE